MGQDALGRRNRDTTVSSDRQTRNLSFFQPEGVIGAIIIEGTIADLNMGIWTVDVVSKFDHKFYPNVQVSSPYQDTVSGAGIYVMPDIGAKCHICIPSDGPPPYVLDFIMPSEQNYAQEEEIDTTSGAESYSDKSFSGGRPRPKPGDIYIRGRDGNFIVLHRGGVLQIGCSELAQRIYIPLENLITDVSQNYRHYNTGGSVNWFLAPGESKDNPHTVKKDTFRIKAADKYATIRVATGRLNDPVEEGIADVRSDMAAYGMATKNSPIYCEVTLAPDGFEADSGASREDVREATVLRYFFDASGNTLLRTQGNVVVHSEKNLTLRAKESMRLDTNQFYLSAKGATITGEDFLQINTKGMRVNSGNNPAAHVGSIVEVPITPSTIFMVPPPPYPGVPVVPGPTPGSYMIAPGTPLTFGTIILRGTVTTGQTKVLI